MRVLRDERGETLLEILITMIVMGLGLVAVVGAIGSSIIASDSHRNLAQGEVIARDFGEAVKAKASSNLDDPGTPSVDEYEPCPGASYFEAPDFDLPIGPGWDGWTVALGDPAVAGDGVEWWWPNSEDFPNGSFEKSPGVAYTQSDCLTKYNECNNAEDPAMDEPACDLSYQRVTFVVSNDRDDYAQADVEARVLVRRPNP